MSFLYAIIYLSVDISRCNYSGMVAFLKNVFQQNTILQF